MLQRAMPPSQGRPGHRRSYSAYDAASPALAHIPRRRPTPSAADDAHRKPTFQLGHDDDDSSPDETMATKHTQHDDDDDRALPPLRLKPKLSPFDSAAQRASPPPQLFIQPPTAVSHSYLPFPQSQSPDGHDPRLVRPSVSRTSSASIMLANGKPLKSSLKSSSSSPNIPFPPQSLVPSIMFPDLHQHAYHHRARSAPSTPHLQTVPFPSSSSSSSDPPSPPSPGILFPQKNVHFPSQDLATVRVFNRSAKPASLSRLGDDTETETEGESSAGGWGGLRPNTWGPSAAKSPLGHQHDRYLAIDLENSTPVPARGAESGDGNVYLESIGFDLESPQSPVPKRPLVLTGSMLVRNVTYQKAVAIRFTLDEWHTTNDVVAVYDKSLRALPARFGRAVERVCPPHAVDALGEDNAVATGAVPAWDRFRFQIKLEDYADALEARTMWLVGHYSQGPGVPSTAALPATEWWDNNMGANYRVAFVRKGREAQTHNRGVIVSAPSVYTPARPPAAASPAPKSYPAPPQISASVSLPQTLREQQRNHAYTEQKTQSTLARLKKLNLLNYAAPTSSTTLPPRAAADSSADSSTTSAESTPLLTPTQADADAEYLLHKVPEQDVDVDVLNDAAGSLHAARPGWGAASTPIAVGPRMMSMGMENGFPATFLAPELTSGGEPPLVPAPSPALTTPEMLGTSPPFSSLSDMALGGGAAGRRAGGGLSWPWRAFGAAAAGEEEGEDDASTPPGHQVLGGVTNGEKRVGGEGEEGVMKTPPPLAPLSAPVASLLSDIRARSTGPAGAGSSSSGFGSGSGFGQQIVPPQRRKGTHAHPHPHRTTAVAGEMQSGPLSPKFTVGGGGGGGTSGSESGSSTSGSGSAGEARRGALSAAAGPSTPTPLTAGWGFRPASPVLHPTTTTASSSAGSVAGTGRGTASPNSGGGSPKRFFLSPPSPSLPSHIAEPPVFPPYAGAGAGPGGRRSPTARSPLRLSPVNSTDEMGGGRELPPPAPPAGADSSSVDGGGFSSSNSGAISTSGGGGGGGQQQQQQPQDDAVYQAFVRQWCFAQAPGPSVGASVGGAGNGNGSTGKEVVPGLKSINV